MERMGEEPTLPLRSLMAKVDSPFRVSFKGRKNPPLQCFGLAI
jgi:hypothetical protein